ncbi:MAG: YhcH/YjgK/YiaL family protein [[Clostridium] leptum]
MNWFRIWFTPLSARLRQSLWRGGSRSHRDYLDIQIDLEGSEQIGISSLEDPRLTVTQAYDKRNDCQLLSGPLTVSCPMGPGRFLILFPHDAHAPGLADGVPGTVKKAVIKVKLENS